LPPTAILAPFSLLLFGFLGVIAFSLVLMLGTLATIVAVITGMLTMLYPLAKRVTYFPQVVLGITFNAGILIAYAATQHALPITAWALYIAAILWTVAYDTMYAMADKQDDIALGLKSTAIKFSKNSTFIIGLIQSLMLLMLCSIGYYSHFSLLYYAGLLCVMLLFLYQHALLLRPQECYYTKAFLNNHWVGGIIFLVIFFQTW
jgi:4-hydroxybenzoate polyprenyltransferase